MAACRPETMKPVECDTIPPDERRRQVEVSMSPQLVGESDPSRTEAPETVAPAVAGRTLRRISPLGADSRRLVRKGT
jgi:hypothetical protein